MNVASEPRIELCRAGQAAFEWLAAVINDLKAADPLAPVTVVPPNLPAGRMILRQLARRSGYVNVRLLRLVDVASSIAGPLLAGRETLASVLEASAARTAAAEVPALKPLAGHVALTQDLTRLFREVRRAEVSLGGAVSPMAKAVAQAYTRFRERTAGLVDPTDARRLAAGRLANAGDVLELSELGALVVFLPTRMDAADAELLGQLAARLPVAVALPDLADPQGLGSRRAREDYELLERSIAQRESVAAGLVPAHTEAATRAATTSDRLRTPLAPDLLLPPDVRIVRVPDPAEEAREVVRAVVASMEAGTPLWRIGVLYRQPDLYASLLRDAFQQAGLPSFGLGGVALAETRPARALLDLLQLPDKSFGREAVLGVVAASPAFTQPGQPSLATWERISRDANVVRGIDQWASRLENYAYDQEQRRRPAPEEAEQPDKQLASLPGRAERARQMAAAVAEMAELLTPPPDGSSWQDFVAWAQHASARFCGAEDSWPEGERAYARMVGDKLAALAAASRFETGATVSLFHSALMDALMGSTCPDGQLGAGVVLGPVQSVAGMNFDQVFLVGLSEGAFPPPPPPDPFFPTDAEDVLGLRERYRQRDREAFLMAIASAGQRVTLFTPESADGRAAYPSRWLLEIASAVSGETVSASSFASLKEGDQPWLRAVRSAREGVVTAAAQADLEDRRLASASAAEASGQPLAATALAMRPDLVLGHALQASAARRSSDLTEFDGNVAALAASSRAIAALLSGQRALSASAVQSWASCPFSYFLQYVLGIRSSDAPEDRWTIDPAERGTLVHEILEEFLRTLSQADPPLGVRSYDERDRELLRGVAERHFEALRASGRAGNPLVWQATTSDVWADLELFLRQDQVWRQEHGWQPNRFEQRFGYDDPDSWPALELEAGGVRLLFRGQVDRVDLSGDSRRAFLYDYKTGRDAEYKEVVLDPVIAGRALQLALYSEVAKRNLPDVEMNAAYWFISTRGGFTMHGLKQPPDQVGLRLHDVLRHIILGIRQGAFPAVPGEEDYWGGFDRCGFCPYDRVCPSSRDQLWREKHESPACHEYEALAAPEAHA